MMLPLILSACCGYALADEGQWKYSSGFDYSTGSYNDSKSTAILYVPYTAGYQQGNLSGKITVSWLSIDGPGNVIGGSDGGVVVPGGTGTTKSESGIGDTWVAVTYELEPMPLELGYLDVTLKTKLPTADEDKGLGTGKMDHTLQLDYMYAADRLTPMATLAYKIKGDPGGIDLRNVFYLSIGADWRYSNKTHIGASLDLQQASSNGVDDMRELFAYINQKMNHEWSLTPYLYIGLSDSSPDVGVGFQCTFKPTKRSKQ